MVFRGDRLKNLQTLAELEINTSEREQEILSLVVEDYSSGPEKDTLNKGDDMWIFGKMVKGREIYIKITLGGYNGAAFCISFHLAEHKLNYPYK